MLRTIPVLYILVSLFCSSCSFLFSSAYGYKNPKPLSPAQIADYATVNQVPAGNSFELDTAYFYQFLKQNRKQYPDQVKNHYQPLQALYFDNTGQLQRFYINCYAEGFPNLAWNKDENFNAFPPKIQAPVDSLVSFQTLSRYLIPLPAAKPVDEKLPDYTVVVFWSRMFGRQSKRLIETVQQNCAKAGNSNIRLLFVNNDNLCAKLWQ